MPLERDDIDRLMHSLDELSASTHCIWEAIEDFRVDIQHELRRLIDTVPLERPQTSETPPEASKPCEECQRRSKAEGTLF